MWVFSAMIFVVGAGLGLFMQILVLAVQNSVEMRDMGVATSSVTFFRTLGGAVGSAMLGAVLIQREKIALPSAVRSFGPVDGPLHAFTSGIDRCYEVAIPVAVLSIGLSFLLREVKLRSGPAANVMGEGDVLPAGESAAAANPVGADGI
jgi:hypothetical protein